MSLKNIDRCCAYCAKQTILTREHLWPKSIHRRVMEINNDKRNLYWLTKIDKEILSEPTIKDVCAECNNNNLSALDDYVCKLFDNVIVKKYERHDIVTFEYEYHRLKRWLLKICFNSARINSAVDENVFKLLLPYILGKSETVGRSVKLYVQLTYPSPLPDQFLGPNDSKPAIFYPLANRVGHFLFRTDDGKQKLLRAVHLQGFSFYLAFFLPDERRATAESFRRIFLEHNQETTLLLASKNNVSLICNGIEAWRSFANARSKLVWD